MAYTRNPPTGESKKVYYEMMARRRMDTGRIIGVGYYTLANQIKSVPLYSQALCVIRNYFPNGTVRIVDFGCGGGLFLLGAQVAEDAFNTDRPSRFDVRGVAFDPMEKRDTERYSGVKVCMIEEAGEKLLNWADVVTIFNVLEHVNDLKECLRTVTRIIRDGGFVLVDVPNGSVMALRGRLLGRWPHLNLHEHINYFTPRGLDDLMKRHGFDCVNRLPGLIQGASGFGVRPTLKQWLRWVLASILFLLTQQRIQMFSHITSVYVKKKKGNTT
jgi:2-polyprenyl-3-methyl-5-hydroxy-6-metoxy-1,4-benzoquinol methylase